MKNGSASAERWKPEKVSSLACKENAKKKPAMTGTTPNFEPSSPFKKKKTIPFSANSCFYLLAMKLAANKKNATKANWFGSPKKKSPTSLYGKATIYFSNSLKKIKNSFICGLTISAIDSFSPRTTKKRS